MSGTATEIPALPVLVPLVALAVVTSAWWLRRHHAFTGTRFAVGVVAAIYGAAVVKAVFLPFAVFTGAYGNDVPWWVYVQPIPLVTADPIGVVLNIVLFVPLGLLLPLVARVDSVRRVTLVAFLVSLGIEVAQLVGDITVSTGRVFDVDDLIGNTLGAVVGFLLYRVVLRLPGVVELAADATLVPAHPS